MRPSTDFLIHVVGWFLGTIMKVIFSPFKAIGYVACLIWMFLYIGWTSAEEHAESVWKRLDNEPGDPS